MADLDSNTALSTDFGFHVRDRAKSMGDYILNEADLTAPGIIHATNTPNLDINPQVNGSPEDEVCWERGPAPPDAVMKRAMQAAELHDLRVASLRRMLEPLR